MADKVKLSTHDDCIILLTSLSVSFVISLLICNYYRPFGILLIHLGTGAVLGLVLASGAMISNSYLYYSIIIIFSILAVIVSIYLSKKWKEHVLMVSTAFIGSFITIKMFHIYFFVYPKQDNKIALEDEVYYWNLLWVFGLFIIGVGFQYWTYSK